MKLAGKIVDKSPNGLFFVPASSKNPWGLLFIISQAL